MYLFVNIFTSHSELHHEIKITNTSKKKINLLLSPLLLLAFCKGKKFFV